MISIIHRWAVLLMMLGGCSFAMRGVDPEWDGTQKPVCSDSYMPVFVDGFASTLIASTTVQAAYESEIPLDASVVAGAIVTSLLYTASAAVGASKYKECRRAKADWYASEAIRESNAKVDVAPSSPAAPSSLAALGSAAPSAQLDSRTVPPGCLQDCAPHKIAWCFDSNGKRRCFRTQQACETQVAMTTAVSGACTQAILTTRSGGQR